MSLTVVTVRDDNGAPSTLESYAGASRYRIGDGNLEIISPNQQILGLYGSGNWLSVYVGNTLKVISIGTALDSLSPDSLSPDSLSPDSLSPDSLSPDDGEAHDVHADDVHGDPGLAAAPERERDRDAGADQVGESAPAPLPADRQRSERAAAFVTPTTRPSWLRPVVIRPRAFRATRVEAQAPAATASRMRRVVIRPRATQAASAQAEPPAPEDVQ